MARSRRKTSKRGITTARSEKQDKRRANRKYRRIVRQQIAPDVEQLPVLEEVSNPWSMDKDGKTYFDADRHPDLMRK